MSAPIVREVVENKIFLVRGHRVMLDRDLAQLYCVETKVFNQSVRRNKGRFPEDFMFQLTKEEFKILRSQFVTSSWGGQRYLPFVFTQEGVAMLSGVLNSPRAIAVNIEIMRAFVRLRRILATHKDLAAKLTKLEKKYNSQFKVVFEAIRRLMREEEKPKGKMGFHLVKEEAP